MTKPSPRKRWLATLERAAPDADIMVTLIGAHIMSCRTERGYAAANIVAAAIEAACTDAAALCAGDAVPVAQYRAIAAVLKTHHGCAEAWPA